MALITLIPWRWKIHRDYFQLFFNLTSGVFLLLAVHQAEFVARWAQNYVHNYPVLQRIAVF